MYYEVFIPSLAEEGFDTTITVEAENWMSALRSGLERTGEGSDIRNVMCNIKEDNSIHVTDAGTRRVFVLREVVEPVDTPDLATEKIDLNGIPPVAAPEPVAPTPEPVAPTPEPVAATPEPVTAPEPSRAPEPEPVREPEPPTPTPEPEPPKAKPDPEPIQADPKPEPVKVSERPSSPAFPPIEEPGGGLLESSWTSNDGRISIGSASYETLRSTDAPVKVVRETRAPSGSRPAVSLADEPSNVSENIMEDVFLEIQQIHEGMEMEAVIGYAMDLSMEKIEAEAGSIMFADLSGTEMYFATARGPTAHQIMDFKIPMGAGIAGFCVKEGVSLSISDAENDPRFYKEISKALGYETRNLCCAPIQHEGRVFGVIELLNKAGVFHPSEVSALTYIAAQLAKYIHDQIMAQEKI